MKEDGINYFFCCLQRCRRPVPSISKVGCTDKVFAAFVHAMPHDLQIL